MRRLFFSRCRHKELSRGLTARSVLLPGIPIVRFGGEESRHSDVQRTAALLFTKKKTLVRKAVVIIFILGQNIVGSVTNVTNVRVLLLFVFWMMEGRVRCCGWGCGCDRRTRHSYTSPPRKCLECPMWMSESVTKNPNRNLIKQWWCEMTISLMRWPEIPHLRCSRLTSVDSDIGRKCSVFAFAFASELHRWIAVVYPWHHLGCAISCRRWRRWPSYLRTHTPPFPSRPFSFHSIPHYLNITRPLARSLLWSVRVTHNHNHNHKQTEINNSSYRDPQHFT